MGSRSVQGAGAVFGGFLVHLTLGSIYSIGNMVPYVVSYVREYSKPSDINYASGTWIFAMALVGQGSFMFIGGIINKKIGPRWTTLIGSAIVSLGIFLTYFTIKVSFVFTVVTYGLVFGAGVGIAYAPPLACAMQWMPERKGVANGIVVGGFGGGAFIFNQIQTAFINPDNLAPDFKDDDERYFSAKNAPELLDRVPKTFLLMGGVFVVMQVVGCILLTTPKQRGCCGTEETEPLLDHEEVDPGSDNPSMSLGKVKPQNKETDPSLGEQTGLTESYGENGVHAIQDLHPLEMIRTRGFYTLWFIFLVNGQAVIFITSLYKAFGQTFIRNDLFLTYVGAFASLFNAFGRVVWGFCADRFGFRRTMMTLCTCMITLMMTLIATQTAAETSQTLAQAMFFIWICGIYWTLSGNFALFPTVTAKTFGQKYVAVNFGLVFTSQLVTGIIGAFLTTSLEEIVGWFGMFTIIAAFSAIGWILALSFNLKLNGKDV